MADTADVVVVGGGVIGTSIAFALASAGVAHVTLLEKGALASGASGRSSTPPAAMLAKANISSTGLRPATPMTRPLG